MEHNVKMPAEAQMEKTERRDTIYDVRVNELREAVACNTQLINQIKAIIETPRPTAQAEESEKALVETIEEGISDQIEEIRRNSDALEYIVGRLQDCVGNLKVYKT